jgi:IS30 family transposase
MVESTGKEKAMDEQQRPAENSERTGDEAQPSPQQKTHPIAGPITDPTNPHNQEPTGHWVANERAVERRNNEPGLTDEERKRRKWSTAARSQSGNGCLAEGEK